MSLGGGYDGWVQDEEKLIKQHESEGWNLGGKLKVVNGI